MAMKAITLEQLAVSRRIVTDAHQNVPAWVIETPAGAWLILTRFVRPGSHQRDLGVPSQGKAIAGELTSAYYYAVDPSPWVLTRRRPRLLCFARSSRMTY